MLKQQDSRGGKKANKSDYKAEEQTVIMEGKQQRGLRSKLYCDSLCEELNSLLLCKLHQI